MSLVRCPVLADGMALVAKSNRMVFCGSLTHIYVSSTRVDNTFPLKTRHTEKQSVPCGSLCKYDEYECMPEHNLKKKEVTAIQRHC